MGGESDFCAVFQNLVATNKYLIYVVHFHTMLPAISPTIFIQSRKPDEDLTNQETNGKPGREPTNQKPWILISPTAIFI